MGSEMCIRDRFVKEMLQAMKKAMPDTTEGKGFGNDEYQDMFEDAVSKALSQKTGLGIAQTVYKSLAPAAIAEAQKRVLRDSRAQQISTGVKS